MITLINEKDLNRIVIKSRGPGISSGYYECGSRLFLWENRRKIEPKEILSCLIPRLLIVITRQLEILVTTLLEQNHDRAGLNQSLGVT